MFLRMWRGWKSCFKTKIVIQLFCRILTRLCGAVELLRFAQEVSFFPIIELNLKTKATGGDGVGS